MITNIQEIPNAVSGIYKINFNNGKIYVGQAINIKNRALEHNSKSKQKCDQALKQYDATIEILEEIKDVSLLDKIESLYIEKYNATNPDIGYNIFNFGNVAGKNGLEHPNSKFTKQTLDEIINLLIFHKDISIKQIAQMYEVTSATIIDISKGRRYFNPNLNYPLRDNDFTASVKDSLEYFQNQEELIALKNDLLYRWDLSIETDLIKKYNIPLGLIHKINNGTKFADIGNFTYPIRKKNIRNNLNFSQQDIQDILYDLRYTSKSMSDIGLEHHGINRSTVAKINIGAAYPLRHYDYPARKKKL